MYHLCIKRFYLSVHGFCIFIVGMHMYALCHMCTGGLRVDMMAVYFSDEEKIGVAPIRQIVDDMVSKHIAAGVVICKNALTPSALKAVRECNQTNRTLHVFQLNEVVVNITHHELVPKHVVQTPEQKKELLDRYRLKEQQLPRIKVTDPVAKYLGLKRGQVVKIIREDSPTAGRYVSYRLVF
eukprot:m.115988 g.115988  ORF g.115988 m.115988 type:complete len:182 (-) comp13585_c0_seq19:110-655(-)